MARPPAIADVVADCPRVSVVIPTRNEARNLPHVFRDMPPDVHEVILVDGRSTDGTSTIIPMSTRQCAPQMNALPS